MNRRDRRRQARGGRKGEATTGVTIPEALERAVGLYEEGRLREALRLCRQLLKAQGEDDDLLHLAGTMAAELGDHAEAAKLLAPLVARRPDHVDAHYNLGNAQFALGHVDLAIESYRRAIELEPGLAEPYNNLGIALASLGRLSEAIEAYQHAIQAQPAHAGAHNNLGIALYQTGLLEPAALACLRAIELNESVPEAHNSLGNILKDMGRLDQATACYQKAIELNPTYAEAYNNLAVIMAERRNLDPAIMAARYAIELRPDFIDAYKNLGDALQQQGRQQDAANVYERALAINEDPGIAVRQALMVPIIANSAEELREARTRVAERLAALRDGEIRLADPYGQVHATHFFLAYQGIDDRPALEDLAAFYRRACPMLEWTAPHCAEPLQERSGDRLRVGFMSRYLRPSHTIGKLYAGLIERLPRERFEIFVFRPGTAEDEFGGAVEHVIRLPDGLQTARERIAHEALDALVYLDIGMEPLSYFLSFSRLAPVQCVTWGHPTTSGVANLDYFLSGVDLDPPDGDAQYSERLERLPRIPVFYRRPEMPEGELPGREALELPTGRRLYVCTQTLFKIHPDFDAVIGGILERDPEAVLVFIEGNLEYMAAQLRQRFEAAFGELGDRFVFLRTLEFSEFLGLCATADVLLDTFPFCGGNTSLEAFGVGGPVVTLPTNMLRGRLTAGFYRQMGVTDLIAENVEHYVDLAVRTATDRDWREDVRARILAAGPAVFEDAGAVDGLAAFLERAIAERI